MISCILKKNHKYVVFLLFKDEMYLDLKNQGI